MIYTLSFLYAFFFHDTATAEIYTLSLHDALPISGASVIVHPSASEGRSATVRGRSTRENERRRAAKPISISAMPSAAKSTGNGVIAPPADSASARWIAVSCACRRAQNASGDGAAKKV